MRRILLFMVAASAATLVLQPAGAGPGALAASVLAVPTFSQTATFDVHRPNGTLLRTQSYRLTDGGGNCCEVHLGVTRSGRLLELGGSYPYYSDDRGATWSVVRSPVPMLGGEGSISAAPGGDVVGVTWSPYTADHLVSYKFTAATGQWQTETIPLHQPFLDRPWLTVVKGPITWAGGTAPYLSVVEGGWPVREVKLVSFDGLTYVVPDNMTLDAMRNARVSAPVATVADADLDATQGPAPSGIAAYGAGRALRDVGSIGSPCGSGDFTMAPDGTWSCLTLGGGASFGVFRVDSNGWIHQVGTGVGSITVRTSRDGGSTWTGTTAPLPDGMTVSGTRHDVKADGVRRRLYVGVRLDGSDAGAQQDAVLRFDYPTGTPSYTEFWEIGRGDRIVESSLGTSSADRMDFTSLVVLPDGKVAVSFFDSTTGGEPWTAVQL